MFLGIFFIIVVYYKNDTSIFTFKVRKTSDFIPPFIEFLC